MVLRNPRYAVSAFWRVIVSARETWGPPAASCGHSDSRNAQRLAATTKKGSDALASLPHNPLALRRRSAQSVAAPRSERGQRRPMLSSAAPASSRVRSRVFFCTVTAANIASTNAMA